MTNPPHTVKTRIAPSPTGNLHVGTAKTALFNFLFARHNNGEFILRIEDTDFKRSGKKFEENIIDGLKWLGISWDGNVIRQSDRINLYEEYLKRLINNGSAFYCQHSEKELEEECDKQMRIGESPRHYCSHREKNLKDGLIRFRNDKNEIIEFQDVIRGTISFNPALIGDFSLAKNLRTPLYNFAAAVDDFAMQISHVIRGEDHISNTPKQILIQEALGFARPIYAHLPLLLGADRSKLSKRHGATSISEYRETGYLPEALFNFLAILGWNPGGDREVFTKEELISLFSLERVQKAGAVFDTTKLDWMNGEYIRKKSASELYKLAEPHLIDFLRIPNTKFPISNEYIEKIVLLEQPRLKKLSELAEKTDYFFKEPEYNSELLIWKEQTKIQTKEALKTALKTITDIEEQNFTKDNVEKIFLQKSSEFKNRGELLWPLRAALSGKKTSPGPFDIMAILGKKISMERVHRAAELMVK